MTDLAMGHSYIQPKARSKSFWTVIADVTAVLSAAAAVFQAHYRIGYSAEAEQSIGSAWTIVKESAGPIDRGHYGVFAIDSRVGRNFVPGTLFVKLVVGVPGDLVEVTPDETKVNGSRVAGAMDSILTTEDPDIYRKTFVLGVDEYFVVGTRPHSFDSRYWGAVKVSQFQGEAWLL